VLRRTESFPLDANSVSCRPIEAFESFLAFDDVVAWREESGMIEEDDVEGCDFELRRRAFELAEVEESTVVPGSAIGIGMITIALPESFLIFLGIMTALAGGVVSGTDLSCCSSSLGTWDFLRSPDFLLFFGDSKVDSSGGEAVAVEIPVVVNGLPLPLASFRFLDDEETPL